MTSHWGELIIHQEVEPGIAALEREQMTKLRPMEVEGSKLHQQTVEQHLNSSDHVPVEKFSIDEMTLHSIKLIQFNKKVRGLIFSVQQQRESLRNGEGDVLSFPPAPSMPELLITTQRHRTKRKYPFMVKDLESKFVRGFGEAAPEIDTVTNRFLLRRSVAAMIAHVGFDVCSESVLESLTDICHEYFQRITKLLRTANDNEALNGTAGFQDVIQRVFHEIGVGSPKVLHEFYQTRIIQYHSNLVTKCENLLKEYEHVTSQDYSPQEINHVQIKEEPVSEDINFPFIDDRQDNDQDIDETEELLQLAGLSGFDIKLEQDPDTGMDSEEMDSVTVKTDSVDTRLLEAYGDPDSVSENNPRTPHFSSDTVDSLPDSSVNSTELMSPPGQVGRPKKKRKR